MTKLRHQNPPHWGPDPARVVDAPHDLSNPERTTQVLDRKTQAELRQLSEKHDQDLIYREALRRVHARLSAGEDLSDFDRVVLDEATRRGL